MVGRWMSVDPLANKYPPLSPYNYVLSNPLNNFDPDGRGTFSIGLSAMYQHLSPGIQGAVGIIFDDNSNIGLELTLSYSPIDYFSGVGFGYTAGIYFKGSSADNIYDTGGLGSTFGAFAGIMHGGQLEFNSYLSENPDYPGAYL